MYFVFFREVNGMVEKILYVFFWEVKTNFNILYRYVI